MPLSLNTSNPLYSYLVSLVCVDDDNIVKDLMGDGCTPDAAIVIGSGTYGRHFRTTAASNNAKGIALTNGFVTKPTTNPVGTAFIVINAGNSRYSRGTVYNCGGANNFSPAVNSSEVAGILAPPVSATVPTCVGTTDIVGTGAHSFGCGVNGNSGGKTFVDGTVENTTASNLQYSNDTYKANYIGGNASGASGYFAADYVWVAYFRKYLTDQEIADLHASLGAGNTFGLVLGGGTDAEAPGASLTGDSSLDAGAGAAQNSGQAPGASLTGASTLSAGAPVADSAAPGASLTGVSDLVAGAVVLAPTLSIGPLVNNTNMLWTNLAGLTVFIHDIWTGALLLSASNKTSDANGKVSVSDLIFHVGTLYRCVIMAPNGEEALALAVAA